MTRIYPLLTHSSPLNTPTLAWYFLFSQLMSFASLQKTPSQRELAHQNHWGSVSSTSPSTHAGLNLVCARAPPTRATGGRDFWLFVRQATTSPGEMTPTAPRPKHNYRVNRVLNGEDIIPD